MNFESVNQGLSYNTQLRATVTNVLKFLCKSNISEESDLKNEAEENDLPKDTTKFLTDFQELLTAVNKDYNEVEKYTNAAVSTSDLVMNLPMSWLNMDCCSDKTAKYRDSYQVQKWFRRLSEYSQVTSVALQKAFTDRLKPVYHSSRPGNSRKVPMVRHIQTANENTIKSAIVQVSRTPLSHSAEIVHVAGNHRILKVSVARNFVALLSMWHLNIEKIVVKGLDESFKDLDDQWDLDTPSKSNVFRKISDLAMSASMHYVTHSYQVEHPFLLTIRFLVTYRSLFTDQCIFCKNVLKDGLPAYVRDYYRMSEACHEGCRPQ